MDSQVQGEIQLRMAHRAILKMVIPGSVVLDIGSGSGALTAFLSQKASCSVTAVDLTADRVAYAAPYAQATVAGNIEEPSTWEQINGRFDYIIFADVLEHLADPWAALHRCKECLNPGGHVIASIPNVAYYRVRQHLLFGRFDYGPVGILDVTHLRFYTAKTSAALFTESGYGIDEFERVFTSRKNRLLGALFPNAFAYEFAIKASPAALRVVAGP